MSSMFEELKSTLEGKTIKKVLEPSNPEQICEFVFDDNTHISFFATELGYWFEPAFSKNHIHTSLDSLFIDYERHVCQNYDMSISLPKVKINGVELKITEPGGRIFVAAIDLFSVSDKKIVKHKKAKSLISLAASFGGMWRLAFSKQYNKNCPKELVINQGE